MTNEQREKLAIDNEHISTAEIEKDIADTATEIEQLERELKAFTLLGDKLSLFRAHSRRLSIDNRREFINNLQAILEYRQTNK